MKRHARTASFALLFAGMSLACEPTMDEVKQKYGPAAKAVFGKITALEGKAKAVPPVTKEGFDLGGKKVVLDGEGQNALFLHLDSMPAPELADDDGSSTSFGSTLDGCGEVVHGEFGGVVGAAESYLEECGSAEYVFVLRTHEDQSPELVNDSQFVPGKRRGDVILFRLADGAPLGGFTVAAENGQTVHVNGSEFDSERIKNDLEANWFVAIQEKLKALAPGSVR